MTEQEKQQEQEQEQEKRFLGMQLHAILEIIDERSANGFATDEKSLDMAMKLHVQGQVIQTMLDGFYKGSLILEEQDGETWVKNATEEEIQEAKKHGEEFRKETAAKEVAREKSQSNK